MIPPFVSNPESMVKVRVIAVKDQLERTVKTLHKANILHIDISEKVEAPVNTSLEKVLHFPCDSLTPIDDIVICVNTGKHSYLAGNIKPIYYTHFGESDIPNYSVAVKWN